MTIVHILVTYQLILVKYFPRMGTRSKTGTSLFISISYKLLSVSLRLLSGNWLISGNPGKVLVQAG